MTEDTKDQCCHDESPDDNPIDCLKDLLGDATEGAKTREFLDSAQAKLEELGASVDAEETTYRTEYPGLVERWKEQDTKICEIRKHLESCYPGWKDWLKGCVCKEVTEKVWQLKADLLAKLGPPEVCLDEANGDLAEAAAQLEAWKTITSWISIRLDLNAALIEEICTLDNCSDRLFALHIFYFELAPAHARLEKPLKDLAPELIDPERYYCANGCSSPPDESSTEMCGFPWLIDPDDYNCKLADVWKLWRAAGVAQVEAQCKFDQIAECRAEYEAASTPEAKRNAAREVLRRCDQKPCPPPTHQPPETPSQQSQS